MTTTTTSYLVCSAKDSYIEEKFDKTTPRYKTEEQWEGEPFKSTLLRHRTIQIGPDEKCDDCYGWGIVDLKTGTQVCVCKGFGIKPLESDPSWIEML
jgi:hypothetical protein